MRKIFSNIILCQKVCVFFCKRNETNTPFLISINVRFTNSNIRHKTRMLQSFYNARMLFILVRVFYLIFFFTVVC